MLLPFRVNRKCRHRARSSFTSKKVEVMQRARVAYAKKYWKGKKYWNYTKYFQVVSPKRLSMLRKNTIVYSKYCHIKIASVLVVSNQKIIISCMHGKTTKPFLVCFSLLFVPIYREMCEGDCQKNWQFWSYRAIFLSKKRSFSVTLTFVEVWMTRLTKASIRGFKYLG